MAKGKKPAKAPPPPEPLVFNIENFATVEVRENSLSFTPKVVTPLPGMTPAALEAEEETTCGMMRMHIEKNEQGKPDFQILYLKPGVPDPTLQENCEQRIRADQHIPMGIHKSPVKYALDEHGLPDIQATDWQKDALTFPVFLTEAMNFRHIKRRSYNSEIDKTESNNDLHEDKRECEPLGTSKDKEMETQQSEVKSEGKIVDIEESLGKHKSSDKGESTGIRASALDIWTSQRISKEFTIYPVRTRNSKNRNHSKKIESPNKKVSFRNKTSSIENKKDDVTEEILNNKEKLNEMNQRPFTATDPLTEKKILVDPSKLTPDENGYYTVYDESSGQNYVIDPPKIIALDPITGKELIIDPRKPVGQYFSVEDEHGNPIIMDTLEQQPYIHTDPVSGAQLIVNNKRVKPYTVIDPRTGAEIRIDPLMTDGKPYSNIDKEGNIYSIMPTVPGEMGVLFKHPKTGEPGVLGGPVMIQDPVTKELKYQEGAFTMRDPVTGQNIKQLGTILKTDPETGQTTLMTNPNYVKHPVTGEYAMEPSLVYNIKPNGRLTAILPDSEREKAMEYSKNKNMTWDDNLGMFIDENSRAKVTDQLAFLAEERVEGVSKEKNVLGRFLPRVRSMDSILGDIKNKSEKIELKKLLTQQIKERNNNVRKLLNSKKIEERKFMQAQLMEKEQNQNLFIKNIIKHFGTRLKYYDKEKFMSHVHKRVCEENAQLKKKMAERISQENNRAFDAMLREMEIERDKLLKVCNKVGTMYEYSTECKSNHENQRRDSRNSNVHYTRVMNLIHALKREAKVTYNEMLQRENDLIWRELQLNLENELSFLNKNIDDLYVKICCQKFLLVN